MPFVTIQIGQCGNQLGATWFDTLAEELSAANQKPYAADAYFYHQHDRATAPSSNKQWTARAVLVDMEPKVIYSARQSAASSKHNWSYSCNSAVSGQSGSGNNWALGHNKFGPALAPMVLDLVRRQVEACDWCEGFLMLQSMAGGTGAGVGTYLAESLTDEFSTAHMLNCCIWPYASGEVTVQPYNTLLSMAGLSEVSTGLLLMQNEVLHATCTRLLGVKNPGFKDLNAVAARGLASALLPSCKRTATPAPPLTSSAGAAATSCSPIAKHGSPGSTAHRAVLATAAAGVSRRSLTSSNQQPVQRRLQDTANKEPHAPCSGATSHQLPLHPLSDLVCHLYSNPSYPLASLRCVPQLPAGSVDFTSFSWPGLLRRLKAMQLAGVYLDENLSAFMPSATAGVPLLRHKYKNRAASSMLVLRGSEAGSVNVLDFVDKHMFGSWAVDPLMVGYNTAKFAGCQMAATLLSTDQACVAPLGSMLSRAYTMHAARAYLHQYEAQGLSSTDLQRSFAVVEDLLAAYAAL